MPRVSKVKSFDGAHLATARVTTGGARLPRAQTRAAVLAFLKHEPSGLTRAQVVRAVQKLMPGIGTTTLYNHLTELIRDGALETAEHDGRQLVALPGVLSRARQVEQVEQPEQAVELPDLPAEEQPEKATERDRILDSQHARELARAAQLAPGAISAAILDLMVERPRPHTRTYIVQWVSRKLPDAPAALIHREISILLEDQRLESGAYRGIPHIALPGGLDQARATNGAPAVEQPAPAEQPWLQVEQVEPPALPDVPHFIDCDLTIAGVDLHARVTIDLPNSIAREATFRYLVRWIAQLERITADVLRMGALATERDQAMELAEDEERKRKHLALRLAVIRAGLAGLDLPEEHEG